LTTKVEKNKVNFKSHTAYRSTNR